MSTAAQQSDEAVLESFGYKQELKRSLSFWTNFAVGFAFISPVVGLYAIIALATFAAGPAWVWALFIVLAGQLLVASVFAELASQFPIAGGIYQWSRRLTTPTYAWFAGWIYVWTIMLTVTAVAYFGSVWLAAVFDATPSANEQVLWALGLLVVTTFVNAVGLNPLKYVVNVGIVAECIASVLIGVLLLLFFRNHPISYLWEGLGAQASFNSGSYFAAFLAAIAISGWAFVGFDSCGSVSEETKDPMRRVPRAILFSLSSVGAVIILNAIAIGLSFEDTQAVMSGEVLDPVTPAVVDAFGSWSEKPFELVVLAAFIACGIAVQATATRVLFSLSRDRMLPGSSFLSRVGANKVPLGALAAASVVSAAGLLFGLNARAVNTLITFGSGGYYITFWLVCVAALYARLSGRWVPAGRFSLGRFALPVNIAAVVWLTFEAINIAWPRTVLAVPGAKFYQVWAIILIFGVLSVIGLVYVLVSRPQDRIARAASMSDLTETEPEAVVR
ncbi:MAG TPA: APC family permease [Solirubrobacteraceae bacterium]|nr:APC family permease [Solirubrobacteraceae bacterium]